MLKSSRLILAVAMAGVALVCCGCTGTPQSAIINAMLNNQSAEKAYMWFGHGEPGPSDLVAPGQFRMIQVTVNGTMRSEGGLLLDDTLRANAKTEAGKVTQEELSLKATHDPGKNLYIRWDGKGLSLSY